jgi:hypothetical protein
MALTLHVPVRNEWYEHVVVAMAIFDAAMATNAPFDLITFLRDFISISERHVANFDDETKRKWAPVRAWFEEFIAKLVAEHRPA